MEHLPNTQKQTEKNSQSGETKKHAPNKRQENPQKATKWNRGKQATRYIVQNNGYEDAQKHRENFNSMKNNIETIKKNQPEMRNTISQIRNTLEGINSRQDEAEDQISVLENKVVENIQTDQNKEKKIHKK